MVAKVEHDCYLQLSTFEHEGNLVVRMMVQSASDDRDARDQVLVRQEAVWLDMLGSSFPGLEEMDMVLEQQVCCDEQRNERRHTVTPGWRSRVRDGSETMPLNEFGERFVKESKKAGGVERFGEPLVVSDGAAPSTAFQSSVKTVEPDLLAVASRHAMSQLAEMLSTDERSAAMYLEMAGGDQDVAVSLFFEHNM